jgi:hypothetical protein
MSETWPKRVQVVLERATAGNLKSHAIPALHAFIYLNFSNTVTLSLLAATFILAKKVNRHPVLINVCITFILSGIFSDLLWYASQHVGPEPNKSLCITQASFLSGTTPMLAASVFSLIYYASVSYDGDPVKATLSRVQLTLMLIFPYIALAMFGSAAAVLSVKHPHKVNRHQRFFYCSLHYNKLTWVMSLFTSVVLLIVTTLEVQLAYNMCRSWRAIRKAGQHSDGANVQILLRVLLFGIYVFMGVIISALSNTERNSPVPDLFAATTGPMVFLVFATQPDVLKAWRFWRGYSSESSVVLCP